jgi:iron complex transport system permease protein
MKSRPYWFLSFLLLAALLLSAAIGAVFIPPATVVQILASKLPGIHINPDWPKAFEVILFQIRLPHTALMAITGAALAASGGAYQGLFRNPLADPYLIGVAAGAGLGAVLAMALREQGWLGGIYLVPLAAFLGAVLTVGVVYGLAYRREAQTSTLLILAGVAVSSFATALTSYLMLRSQGELRRSMAWLFGGGALSGWEPVIVGTPYILLGLVALLTSGHALNVLQFGEEQAGQLGLSVNRAKTLIVVSASLATAAAVAFTGIIGFIGLIVPHIIRILWGTDYRRLLPLALLGGASALLLADLIARLVLRPQEVPVGIITSLAGAPFFLWILWRNKKKI